MSPVPPVAPDSAAAPPRPHRLTFGGIATVIAAALLAVWSFHPADAVLDASLDASNYASYAAFTAHGAHYGRDAVPMAGPYGFINYGFVYGGDLFGLRLALELLVKASFAALVFWFFRQAASRAWRWLWLAAVVVTVPLIDDTPYDVAILLAGLFLILNFNRAGRPTASCVVAALLALLSLCKGTQSVLAVATLGAVGVQAALSRRWARGAWIVAVFAASYLLLWLAAGQDVRDLPAFWRGIAELSSGYNNAMGLVEAPRTTALGAGTLGLLLAAAGWAAWLNRRHTAALLATGFFAGFAFVEWKHGFVRADGHVFIFFHFALIGALMPRLIASPTAVVSARWLREPGGSLFPDHGTAAPAEPDLRAGRRNLATLTFALAAIALAGFASTRRGEARGWLEMARVAFPARLAQLLHPAAAKAGLDAALARNREKFALPAIRRTIGTGTADFFGFEHGYIPLNGLRYDPRPVGGGGFNVYTEYLKRLNETFLLDPARRPDFYLLKTQTLDGRLLTQDDSRALLPLLFLYRPVATERDVVLFAQTPRAAPPPAPTSVVERVFHWDEPVAVPPPPAGSDDLTLVSFHLEPTWLGRLRAFFYKPPRIFLQLSGDGILRPEQVRVIPEMVRSPVILNPLIEDSRDLLALYSTAPGKRVRTFRVTSDHPALYRAKRLRVSFFRLPRPPPDPAAAAVAAKTRFPSSNVAADLVEPAAFPHYLGEGFVVGFHAPSRAVFPADGTERIVTLTFGIEPGAYRGGRTDGVDFILEVQPPGAGPQSVFHRFLQPLTVPADRGTQSARIVLPPIQPGSKIILRTDPGPNHDSGWDWSYIGRIQFDQGPYLPEQFAGFNVAPAAVEGANAGRLNTGDRVVFMLNAPGMLRFDLGATERTLTFTGGLLPGAYTGGGHSDGAAFVVELRSADGTTRTLLDRLLQPRTVPADAGPQSFTVPLPAHAAGAQLFVRTNPGPAGDESWDWTYLVDLHIN